MNFLGRDEEEEEDEDEGEGDEEREEKLDVDERGGGKREEEETSLQLPIYHLLVHHCQKRRVTKMSYWYLERNDFLTEQPLPDLEDSGARVLRLAQKMKVARQLGKFNCKEQDGCFACLPMEHVINGKAQYVGNDEYRRDVYVLETATQDINSEDSVVL